MAWKSHLSGADAKSPNMNVRNGVRRSSKSSSEKKPLMQAIAQIEKQRDERRKAAAELIEERRRETELNEKMGRPGDVDFQRMIKKFRQANEDKKRPYTKLAQTKITICVRKRPVNAKEVKKRDYDSVTCLNPSVIVHECRLRVDGITKYLDNNEFVFDNSFDEYAETEEIYQCSVQHLVPFIFDEKGCATVFAYGQTGSGKTYTMEGIQRQVAVDLFNYISYYESKGIKMNVYVSFFELYAGRCQDLLSQERLTIREDGKGEVQIIGLEERQAQNIQELFKHVEAGNRKRTTRKTEVNDQSSRSHGICQINIRNADTHELHGKLSLIDLAGSERAADSNSHNRQRRMESSEINKSLLALKECIRALDNNAPGVHIPFRASQLTQVLKDSFTNSRARTVMIAAISPCASSADHTVNTLRYADRVKEKQSLIEGNNDRTLENPSVNVRSAVQDEGSNDMTDEEQTPLPPKINAAVGSPPPIPAAIPKKRESYKETNEDRERENRGRLEDIKALHNSLRRHSGENFDEEAAQSLEEFHEVVQGVYEAQEELLNSHHESIKENAELLTEETALFTSIQGDDVVDYDIDQYVKRLEEILDRKSKLVSHLRQQLQKFRQKCEEEENASKKVGAVSYY